MQVDVTQMTAEQRVELLAQFSSNELMLAFLSKCNMDVELATIEMQKSNATERA
jgi:hypothetical protein